MKKKILIIDDEPDFLELTQMRLEAHGYDVSTAPHGTAGIAAAQESTPDIILLDIMMPGEDGGDVKQRLKTIPALAHVPVVFLTALVGESEAAASQSPGREEQFLSKTGGSEKIIAYIEATLD